MDPIKEAFLKIKEDIFALSDELNTLRSELFDLKEAFIGSNTPTITPQNPTFIPKIINTPTPTPTVPQEVRGLKPSNFDISTGNQGVPTDKPTNQQTNQQTNNYDQNTPIQTDSNTIDNFQELEAILNTLDSVKKGIRLKFKRLTPQEMAVFSTLYTLEDQNIEEITHKTLANHLKLSESSIRDYINKLITKGVPVLKSRSNNKKIALSISKELRKTTNLATISRLRDI